jgi:uncharacterized protein DUF5908
MPLEIRELIIKATVNNGEVESSPQTNENNVSNEATINEVVEKVFEILREKSER